MIIAYVAMGSNLGDRLDHLRQAALDLDGLEGCRVLKMSSVFETEPMGPQSQPDYLNAVCRLECALKPRNLLNRLKTIERKHGRIVVEERWTARPLDLDIVVYGQRVVHSLDLQIPHIGLAHRSFVLWPLAELDDTLVIPGMGPVLHLKRFCQPLGIHRFEH